SFLSISIFGTRLPPSSTLFPYTTLFRSHGEVFGLTALLYLQHSRRDARQDASGELITLEQQDRSRWHQADIQRGLDWLAQALQLDRKSTRLNSSHVKISYAVFCLKKKN